MCGDEGGVAGVVDRNGDKYGVEGDDGVAAVAERG